MKAGNAYMAEIITVCSDRRGIFSDISRACEDQDVKLEGVNTNAGKDGSLHVTLTLMLSDTQKMQRVLRSLRNVEGVSHVYRARS